MYKALLVGLGLCSLLGNAVANEVTNPREIRVVALAPHIVENLFAIGAGSNIVGTVDYADSLLRLRVLSALVVTMVFPLKSY